MLFNSYTFVAVFLPILLVLAWLSGRAGRRDLVVPLLLGASLVFYAWWSLPFLGLLAGSILVNHALGRLILHRASRWQLWLGIAFNLALLGYFKYANFFIAQWNALLGTSVDNPPILLPLAISFFTFQQIAYLVDCRRGEAVRAGLMRYALFVCFFPQLIAGPIVRSTEVMPQLAELGRRLVPRARDLGPALSLFVIGLAKKVLLADNLALYATPVFVAADTGVPVTGAEAWIGALTYTLQLYFDFSGYSDMAIGLAWMFGVRLPVNFLSPYRATSITEFWRRWHITLSRFLRDYLYIPLGGNRRGRTQQFVNLMLTMLLGGLWHGAGWTFILWGGLHGAYLVINQAWAGVRRRLGWSRAAVSRPGRMLAWALTFAAVVLALVLFRAETLSGAGALLSATLGLEGFTLPRDYATLAPGLAAPLAAAGASFSGDQVLWALSKVELVLLLVVSFALILGCPNSARLFGLVTDERPDRLGRVLAWRPSAAWAVFTVALFAASLVAMTSVSEFLYYQF